MSLHALRRIQESIEADTLLVAQGRLQRSCTSFFCPARGDAVRGAVLMLHGWTAGPWQFIPLAKLLSDAGLHCYAARMPGHGACLQDGSEDPSLLPLGAQSSLYGEAAETAYQRILALVTGEDIPLYVFGFSLGGAVAVDLVRMHGPQIHRLVLAAPMLRPRPMPVRMAFRVARGAGRIGAARLYDRIPHSWGVRPVATAGGWVRPGHWNFRVGNLFSAMSYARQVFRSTRKITVPTQLFVSESDHMSDPATIVRLLHRSRVEHYVWRFGEGMKVPHAMLTAEENPNASSREFLSKTTLEFLLYGRGRTGLST